MSTACLPDNREIRILFENEMAALGGAVQDVYDDGSQLFLRAVIARSTDVHPGDSVRAGVALRTCGDDVLLHPYTFRQVCKNGMIMAHAIETRRVERVEPFASEDAVARVMSELREAVSACSGERAFSRAANAMRSASDVEADMVLQMMPLVSQLPTHLAAEIVRAILSRFYSGRDRSLFGAMNAVTSVARDTRDPVTRWQLEELGGGMLARLAPKPRPAPTAAECVMA